ncbi:hypothetical protein [Crocosphaera sp. Alani8]|uniref:hypothetical protein n=1 Tax=Crocosphaera sp. Alani8 TaxID=3038952 RepID=UPI00313AAA84
MENDFYTLLENIKKRPPLYLGWYSIFAFESFYSGYLKAKEISSLSLTDQEKEFQEFLIWIQEDYSSVKVNRSWSVLMFLFSSDERKALDKLFELFEQYLEQKNN